MSRATPKMRDLAARLIAERAKANPSSGPSPPAGFHVCESLRPHLAALMGKGGFQALLSRALAVAAAEMGCLRVVKVNADGNLEGWEKAEGQPAEELTEAGVLLVAQLLGLLVAFIGDSLTLRLVREVWPKESLDDLNITPGDRS